MSNGAKPSFAATGVAGLDDILRGGFPTGRLLLIEGDPGAGKTTLTLQFLLEGQRRGEPGLYVALAESREELDDVAASHGWPLDGLSFLELAPPEGALDADERYTVFHPGEVELDETTRV